MICISRFWESYVEAEGALCEYCGVHVDSCDCPECPECGTVGDPACSRECLELERGRRENSVHGH